jgi:flavodoxin
MRYKIGLRNILKKEYKMKSLIICKSVHVGNTKKVARRMAKTLNANLIEPKECIPNQIKKFDLIGFGSGIYSAKHHKSLLDLADKLPMVTNKRVFIFSTAGVTGEKKVKKDHLELRSKLESKGYLIVDEFSCKGFNKNSFLKYFGGMNKGRPNETDFKLAEDFARNMIV